MKIAYVCVALAMFAIVGCTQKENSTSSKKGLPQIATTEDLERITAKLPTKDDMKGLATKDDIKAVETKLYKDGKINPDLLPLPPKLENPVPPPMPKDGPPPKNGGQMPPPKNGGPPLSKEMAKMSFSAIGDWVNARGMERKKNEAMSKAGMDMVNQAQMKEAQERQEFTQALDELSMRIIDILKAYPPTQQQGPGGPNRGMSPPAGPGPKTPGKEKEKKKGDSKLLYDCPSLAKKAEFYAGLLKKKGELELRLAREKERLERDILRGTHIVTPYKTYATTPAPWPLETVAKWRQEFEDRAAAERASFCSTQEQLEQAFLERIEAEYAFDASP